MEPGILIVSLDGYGKKEWSEVPEPLLENSGLLINRGAFAVLDPWS